MTELTSYPVKGCAGVRLTEAALSEAGLAHDRSLMVVSESGAYRSQRRDPRLAVIRPELSADGARLTLHAPEVTPLRVDVDVTAARRSVTLFGASYQGIDQGERAAGWLTGVLGVPSRLVRVPPEHDRVTDGWMPGTSGYSDSGAVHVVSRSSLDALNSRIVEGGGAPLPMTRFRPNIVVDGWADPHREDLARRVTVGDVALGYAKLAGRCVVTTVDQERGVKRGPEPLRTLAGYRRAVAGGVVFGAKFSVLRTGRLAVGDAVNVTEWGDTER